MVTPLLATKLYIPPLRRDFVPRPRLLARLDEGLERRLVLVSAPAGFGKTTLLSEWLLTGDVPSVAWLSLDADDNDLARFLSYLVAALAPVAPEVDEATGSLLRLPQVPPSDIVLTTLINALCSLPDDLVLVLEDYHTIEARPVHTALTFLTRQPSAPGPPGHLDPRRPASAPLPLALAGFDGRDPRRRSALYREESAAYLNDAMNLHLLPEDVASSEPADRGLDCGPADGGSCPAGQEHGGGCLGFCPGLFRQPPLYSGLPG